MLDDEVPLAGFALSLVTDGDDNKHRDLPVFINWRSTRSPTRTSSLGGLALSNGHLDQVNQVTAVLGRSIHGWASAFGFATTQPYGGSAFFAMELSDSFNGVPLPMPPTSCQAEERTWPHCMFISFSAGDALWLCMPIRGWCAEA